MMKLLERAPDETEGQEIWLVKDDLATPNIREFEEELNILSEEATGDVVLDLDDVGRLDSSGVGLLLYLLRRTKERGAKLIFRRPSTLVLGVLKTTAMDRLAEVEL